MTLAALLAAVGLAVQGAPAAVVVYEPAFFAEARPTTALDMIERLPGFVLMEGDEEIRGFAGAAGNILFDGRPPASKQEALEAQLRRIPAESVERIELIRGGAPGIDMAGFDLVANIVRRRAQSGRAAAEAGLSIGLDGRARPSARLEMTHDGAGRRLEGMLALASQIDEDSGRGSLDRFDRAGMRLGGETRREREVETSFSASGGYEAPIGGGTASFNGSLGRERSVERIFSEMAGGARERASELETQWNGEAAARYGSVAGAGRADLLLLQRVGRIRVEEEEEGERFDETTRTRETIVRLDYRQDEDALSFDAAVEGALNGLSSRARLIEDEVEIELPGGDAAVREERAEGTIGVTWRARPDLIAEASLRAEVSSLRSDAQRLSFLFWKPRVALTAPLGPGRLRISLEREVGQLDFRDFVATASIDRGDVSAGAVSLRPPRLWRAGADWDLRFWTDGAISLSWHREWIEDVVDRVAVRVDGEIFDAVGNIGSGRRDIGQAEISLPLSRFGLAGVQLRGALTRRRGRVTDPATGRRRPISEDVPLEGEFRIIHDVPGGRWSWGLDLALAERERLFRFDESRLERQGPTLAFHVEYRPSPGWRLRLEALNLTGRTISEVREEYDGVRGSVPLDAVERRRISTSPLLLLTVRRAFGAQTRRPGQAGSTP